MDLASKLAELDKRIADARAVQANASAMNRAAGVFAAEDILLSLYAERDALAK